MVLERRIGRSGLTVSALGLGCWAIGGSNIVNGKLRGWGPVDDNESIRAIQTALEFGVTSFDTADAYGAGRSERVLGQALAGRRDQVIIATKFGKLFNEQTGERFDGVAASPDAIRRACADSLRRLKTDYIDLYQFHEGKYDLEQASAVRDTLEQLVTEGLIRYYGWSTDNPERAQLFAEGSHCVAIQQRMNIFEGSEQTLAICEAAGLASINRSPLAQGLLTGKFTVESQLPEEDLRHKWNHKTGVQAEQLSRLQSLRDVLTSDGRTLAQGAMGWIWAHSPITIPIPGFKTVAQVRENVGALRYGPLSDEQMRQIAQTLGNS
ncbi:MAG: aldo/keto reductase [Chloroflexales bacterium]|nr:aldo/keto reductase [Chloroflexales bacterium]